MRLHSLLVSLAITAGVAGCQGGSKQKQAPEQQPPPLGQPEIAHLSHGIGLMGDPFQLTVFGFNLRDPAITQASTVDGPVMRLSRTRDLDGNAADGPELSRVAFVYPGSGNAAQAWIDVDPALPEGVYSLSLRTAAGLEVHREDAMLILPRPHVTSVDPDAICIKTPHVPGTPRAEKIAISGTALHRLLPLEPTVSFFMGGPSGVWNPYGTTMAAETISGCRPVAFAGAEFCLLSNLGLACGPITGVDLCTRIEARLPDDVVAHMGVGVTLTLRKTVAGDPETFGHFFIEKPDVWPVEYLGIRAAVDAPLELQIWRAGWPLLFGSVAQPTVLLDGAPFPIAGSECVPSGMPGKGICGGLTATIPQGYATGTHSFEVTTVSGCTGSASVVLAPRPEVTAVIPPSVCAMDLQSVRIEGSGFLGPDAIIDGQHQTAFTCTSNVGKDCIGFVLTGAIRLPVGTHSIAVENPSDPPLRSNSAILTVTPGPPTVGSPTPHLIYSGAIRNVFVPVSHLTGGIVSARLSTGLRSVAVDVVEVTGGAEVTVPPLGGSDLYEIDIADESGCIGRGFGLFTAADAVLVLQDFETGAAMASTVSTGPDAPPALVWQAGGGNPGGELAAQRSGPGSDWYFSVPVSWSSGVEVGLIRFDLRATATGDPTTSPGLVLKNLVFQLERPIAAPPADGAWTHYEISLQSSDGWTYRDAAGARAARAEDLAAAFGTAQILGSWATGAAEASVDNVAVELAR